MPPTIIKGFAADNNFVTGKKIGPLGSDIGSVELEDGTMIDSGKGLMRPMEFEGLAPAWQRS